LRSSRCLLSSRGRCLYELLGVPQTATISEIHAAYEEQKQSIHPNYWPRASRIYSTPSEYIMKFQQVAHAYEVLRDEPSRRHYDNTLQDSFEERSANYNPPIAMLLGLGSLFLFDALSQPRRHSQIMLVSQGDEIHNLELVRMACD